MSVPRGPRCATSGSPCCKASGSQYSATPIARESSRNSLLKKRACLKSRTPVPAQAWKAINHPKTKMSLSRKHMFISCFVVASMAIAATPKTLEHLTAQRIADFTSTTEGTRPKAYKIEIADFGRITLAADNPEGQVELGQEFRFPTEFAPPQITASGVPAIVPTTPTAFETVNTGWTVRLTAKPHGKLVGVYGIANYVEVALVPGGYGAIAGPIYTERGEILTENKLDQPKLQATETRFHIFAAPGESYDVTFYKGSTEEKHRITVTLE